MQCIVCHNEMVGPKFQPHALGATKASLLTRKLMAYYHKKTCQARSHKFTLKICRRDKCSSLKPSWTGTSK